MRRSAAPSQTGGSSSKRGKFVSPLLRGANKFGSSITTLQRNSVCSSASHQSRQNKDKESTGPLEYPTPTYLSNQLGSSLFNCVIRQADADSYASVTGGKTNNFVCESKVQQPWHQDANRSQDVPVESDHSSLSVKPATFWKKSLKSLSVLSEENAAPGESDNTNLPDHYDEPVQQQSAPVLEEASSTEPLLLSESCLAPSADHKQQARSQCQTSTTRYFSVVWCKFSKKKHKKWEGDAVLRVIGRTATLYDMDGKIIGRGSGYKTSNLESLREDETVVVGGKEVQVLSTLTEEHFKSGKCFSSVIDLVPVSDGDKNHTQNIISAGVSKPFTNPVLKSNSSVNLVRKAATGKMVVTPKYDPHTPGALIMPRPGSAHQWKYNQQGLNVVDVVVDPYLSDHLRSHQREGVVFLYECVMGMRDHQAQGAVLADDMGLGKTVQCICLIWTLLKQGPYGGLPVAKKVLIVTPGTLVKNWYLEFRKWLGSERLNVFAVSADKRVDEFVKCGTYPVMVTSYEMFVRCYDVIKLVPFDLLICDEGHRLKNTAIKTSSLLMSLPCCKRIVLTGTPIQNDLHEFYSIVQFCNPGILGTSSAFRHIYEAPILASRQPQATVEQRELGAERAQELTRLTQMFVLRRTQEINNDYLPPKVELVLFCQPTNLQLNLYRHLIHSDVVRGCLSGSVSRSPHLVCLGALRLLCNHPGLVYRKAAEEKLQREANSSDTRNEESNDNWENSVYDGLLAYFPESFDASTVSQLDSGKLIVLSGLLSSIWFTSPTEKVVLVSNHTKTLDVLQVFCHLQGYSFLRLDGQTPTSHRQDIVTRFNSNFSSCKVFLLSSKAGGVGLNLVGAARLVLYDVDWNPANDLQAMSRVWRDGQKGKVYIYRLITAGTVEEKIYQRQIFKQDLTGTILDHSTESGVHFSLEDLKDLFSLNERGDCETHSMLGCQCEGEPAYISAGTLAQNIREQRQCQLGRPVSNISKKNTGTNLTMAELSHWKHWRGEFVFLQKLVLGSCWAFTFFCVLARDRYKQKIDMMPVMPRN